jgi:hypothetical protein
VTIKYSYMAGSGIVGRESFSIENQLMGTTPVMGGLFAVNDNDRQLVLELNNIVPGGLKYASKIDDWTYAEFPFKAFPNCAGIIGTLHLIGVEEC